MANVGKRSLINVCMNNVAKETRHKTLGCEGPPHALLSDSLGVFICSSNFTTISRH